MATYIKIKVKPHKDCTNQKILDQGFQLLEVRHDLLLGFCRDLNHVYVSGFPTLDLAVGESIDDIIKQYDDICTVEDLSRHDAAAETMKEGMRRVMKDSQDLGDLPF